MILALLVCTLDLALNGGPPRKAPEVQTIVLHHTTLPTMGNSIRVLRLRGMSYHYLIDDTGAVVNAVPFTRTAYHAAGANDTSVGIAFTGGMDTTWEPTPKQRAAAKALITTLVRQHPGIRYLIGHGDVRDINAGEPYGVSFDQLLAELEAESSIKLLHPHNDEQPLAAYRELALERLANPRTVRTPSRRRRRPAYEAVTCRSGKRTSRVRYPVTLGR
ncbi:MAG TPA: peptidoglycan recognition family protein [Bryobacteraceae bacterium]|nr:peptidoglycan recognition family protein [Bryobacteraceae bacterium]